MKKLPMVIGVILSLFLFTGIAIAADDLSVEVIQSKVSTNKEKAKQNNSRIQKLEEDLATEIVERTSADSNLQSQINNIQLTPGPPGTDGEDGRSAHQIWLDSGNSGTEADFLASLKGDKGDTGDIGPQGEQGPPGLSDSLCQILVAASGGDFTSIQDALDSVNPTPEVPCTILVAADSYVESFTIKTSHIHIKGTGYDRTFLQPDSSNPVAITLDGVENVKISGFTITNANLYGINSTNSSLTIDNNQFIGNEVAIELVGSEGIIEKNIFDNNGGSDFGSISIKSSKAFVSDNTFIGGEPVTTGLEVGYGNTMATIIENTFTNLDPAIDNQANHNDCLVKISGNMITGSHIDAGIINEGPAIISENMVEKCALYGILNYADQAVISNNLLRNNGENGGDAIVTNGNATITGNSILNNQGNGINVIGGIATINGNTFTNNQGYGVTSAGTAVVMGNAFVDNLLGCIRDVAETVVAANLCDDALAVEGVIASEYINTDVDGNVNISAKDLNISAEDLNVASENINILTSNNIAIDARDISANAALNTSLISGNDATMTAGGNTDINSGANTTITTGADTTITTNGDTDIASGGPVIIKGATIMP